MLFHPSVLDYEDIFETRNATTGLRSWTHRGSGSASAQAVSLQSKSVGRFLGDRVLPGLSNLGGRQQGVPMKYSFGFKKMPC